MWIGNVRANLVEQICEIILKGWLVKVIRRRCRLKRKFTPEGSFLSIKCSVELNRGPCMRAHVLLDL